MIRDQIRALAKKDLQTIHELTGETNIQYHDIVYLKEKIKSILLARDKKNI